MKEKSITEINFSELILNFLKNKEDSKNEEVRNHFYYSNLFSRELLI